MKGKNSKVKSAKFWMVIIILLFCVILSYAVPRSKYVGTKFISGLNVPIEFQDWEGRDITSSLNINPEEMRFGFISEALGHEYVNTTSGEKLLFIILDAGNFHDPKNCFTSSGYEIKELGDTGFDLPGRNLKAHTLFTKRGNSSSLSFYWIVIDKNIAHEWIEQKIKQLFFSLLGKKRIGLMVRVDIPAKEYEIKDAMILAKKFIRDLSLAMHSEQAEYLFGEN